MTWNESTRVEASDLEDLQNEHISSWVLQGRNGAGSSSFSQFAVNAGLPAVSAPAGPQASTMDVESGLIRSEFHGPESMRGSAFSRFEGPPGGAPGMRDILLEDSKVRAGPVRDVGCCIPPYSEDRVIIPLVPERSLDLDRMATGGVLLRKQVRDARDQEAHAKFLEARGFIVGTDGALRL